MTMKDATRPLRFVISRRHIAAAQCGDPNRCVIAEALKDALVDHVAEIHVGAAITKIVDTHGDVVRYATPSMLRKALRKFDQRKGWELPTGEWELDPVPANKRLGRDQSPGPGARRKRHRHLFGHRAPTRHVTAIGAIVTEQVRKKLRAKYAA
jgi:hypothetical protein